jgi:hypothetical protein
MDKQPGLLERFRTNVVNGWNRLQQGVNTFRTERNIEQEVVVGLVNQVGDRLAPQAERLRDIWASLGDNFGQRIRNVAMVTLGEMTEVWGSVRERVEERGTELRDRYRGEGVVGATLGIVAEAVETVRDLPDTIGERLNMYREVFEYEKVSVIAGRQDRLQSEAKNGWEDKLAKLNLVRKAVEMKMEMYRERAQRCADRLAAMQYGRERFVRARTTAVLSAMPAAE